MHHLTDSESNNPATEQRVVYLTFSTISAPQKIGHSYRQCPATYVITVVVITGHARLIVSGHGAMHHLVRSPKLLPVLGGILANPSGSIAALAHSPTACQL